MVVFPMILMLCPRLINATRRHAHLTAQGVVMLFGSYASVKKANGGQHQGGLSESRGQAYTDMNNHVVSLPAA